MGCAVLNIKEILDKYVTINELEKLNIQYLEILRMMVNTAINNKKNIV